MATKVSDNIEKSKVDDREYRFLELENKIKCILVHDKDVEKSSATMFVGVGNLSDYRHPNGERIHGLAHFCEHMLFLGTEKYPRENYYNEFISTHGGRKNAATSEDYTYYYFDIANDAFEEALDIFS